MFSCSADVVENMTAPVSASYENLTKNYWFTNVSRSSRMLPVQRLIACCWDITKKQQINSLRTFGQNMLEKLIQGRQIMIGSFL